MPVHKLFATGEFCKGNKTIGSLDHWLRKTTLHYEDNNPESTTVFDNVPLELRQRILHAITGFEIEILSLENVFKLSQDRDLESYHNIIAQLQQKDFDAQVIAAEMQKRVHDLFPGHK